MKEIKEKELRQFGVVLGLILGVFGLVHFLKGHVNICICLWAIALIIISVAILIPQKLKYVYKVFIKLARAIGWFNTRVILVLVYYLILTPIGIVMRVLGKANFIEKKDASIESCWIARDVVVATKESLEKQF